MTSAKSNLRHKEFTKQIKILTKQSTRTEKENQKLIELLISFNAISIVSEEF